MDFKRRFAATTGSVQDSSFVDIIGGTGINTVISGTGLTAEHFQITINPDFSSGGIQHGSDALTDISNGETIAWNSSSIPQSIIDTFKWRDHRVEF